MSDLTGQLQRMADDAAHRARPLAADEVIRRGDRRRQRSFMWQSADGLSAAGIVAAVALAVTALVPASHQTTTQPPAWTVAKLADGNISVRIRQLSDPAALQRALRADGVPATVTFPGHLNPACRHYPASEALRHKVFLPPPGPAPSRTIWLVIDPSALPGGAGVQIAVPYMVPAQKVKPGERPPFSGPSPLFDLVHASPACTGN